MSEQHPAQQPAPEEGGSPAPPPGYGPPPPGYPPPSYPPRGYGPPPPGYGPPAGGPGQHQGAGRTGSEDTLWAVLAHLSFFVLGLIAPLVILLTSGERSPFIRGHAAEALNFHITVLIASVVSFALIFVVVGIFLLPAVLIAAAVFSVLAAVAAGRGQPYRYPVNLRLVR
jgi:uncharacterized Tic20 family protein